MINAKEKQQYAHPLAGLAETFFTESAKLGTKSSQKQPVTNELLMQNLMNLENKLVEPEYAENYGHAVFRKLIWQSSLYDQLVAVKALTGAEQVFADWKSTQSENTSLTFGQRFPLINRMLPQNGKNIDQSPELRQIILNAIEKQLGTNDEIVQGERELWENLRSNLLQTAQPAEGILHK
jgi:hypothetical protein